MSKKLPVTQLSDDNRMVSLGDFKMFARVQGEGSPVVVLEAGLGGSSPEWWHIQTELARFTTVVSYDRAGMGWSEPSPHTRTSRQIAIELYTLLQKLVLPGPYLLVGHSQGGLYIQHFARMYPAQVAGAVFLDPLSPYDYRFRQELAPDLFKKSGVDKTGPMKQGLWISRLGLLPLLKGLFMKSPPFYYYRNIDQSTIEVLWQHFIRRGSFGVALEEYRLSHSASNTAELLGAGAFPAVPIKVVYHDPKITIAETIKYGGLNDDEARQVENLWETLIKEYLELSPQSEWVEAPGSSHFIQFDCPALLIDKVLELVKGYKQSLEADTNNP